METESKLRKPPQRPSMLKDFLRDDFSSCSSSGFRSLPRRSCYASVRNLLEMDLKTRNANSTKLLRNRSKTASKTISAFQKASEAVLSVVKHLHLTSVKSPLSSKQRILPRSLSKRLRRSFTKRADKDKREIRVAVQIKDIIRWRSFRDLVEEKEKPLDCSSSPIHSTTITTTTRNSWSDSDFTSEFLHSSSGSSEFSGENDIDECKKYLSNTKKISKRRGNEVGEDSTEKGESQYEKDQFSPVSVLDFPFEEDEETSLSFQSSLEKMKRTDQKLMQKIQRFKNISQLEPIDLEKRISSLELDDSLKSPTNSQSIPEVKVGEESIKAEEKARELLKLIKQTSSEEDSLKETTDLLLMDFFRDEIMERNLNKPKGGYPFDHQLLSVARAWTNGHYVSLDWGVQENREVYIKEMERGGRWNNLKEEQEEFALDIELRVLSSLMNELLFDLSS